MTVLPESSSEFGQRVRRRLAEEKLIWLTTVAGNWTPQPNPVWFLWSEDRLLVYNAAGAKRLAHVGVRPEVSAHFDSDGTGGNIVVLTGQATLAPGHPPAHEHGPYLAKYRDAMIQVSGSVEAFGAAYPTPMQVVVSRVRGF